MTDAVLRFQDALTVAASAERTTRQRRLIAMSDSVRALIQQTVQTKAPVDVLDEVQGLVRAAIDRLSTQPSGDPYIKYPSADADPAEIQTWQDCGPVLGRAHPASLRFHVTVNGDTIVAEGAFDRTHQGRPGYAHGGYIAALFDQALGLAIGTPSVTATLTVNFLKPTPTETTLRAICRATTQERRKVTVEGELSTVDGTVTATATALYIAKSEEQMAIQFDRAN